ARRGLGRGPQAVEPGQAAGLRERDRADPAAAGRRPLPGEVLRDGDAVHPLRHRDHLPVPVGGDVHEPRGVRAGRDGALYRHGAGRVRVRVAARRAELGLVMGIEEKLPSGILLTSVEKLAGYARKSSVWPATFGLACCAIELFSVGGPRHDLARFGMERASNTPGQADLMIVAGRVSQKMAPVLRQIYDQMSDPKWVISMGVCASSGGMFNNYAIVQGVDHIVPVDIYLPGCPPRPEMLLDSIVKLHDKIQNMKLGANRQAEIEEREQARPGRLPRPWPVLPGAAQAGMGDRAPRAAPSARPAPGRPAPPPAEPAAGIGLSGTGAGLRGTDHGGPRLVTDQGEPQVGADHGEPQRGERS